MARNDGRVEKGQSIRSAFSAKAWNRAQDAADIVLGVRPGVEAGDSITENLPYTWVYAQALEDTPRWGAVEIYGHAGGFAVNSPSRVLMNNKVWSVRRPTADDIAFGVAVDEIPAGGVGRVAVSGTVLVIHDIGDGKNLHRSFMRARGGTFLLHSAAAGHARVIMNSAYSMTADAGNSLWNSIFSINEPGIASKRWAIVRLDSPALQLRAEFRGLWQKGTAKNVHVCVGSQTIDVEFISAKNYLATVQALDQGAQRQCTIGLLNNEWQLVSYDMTSSSDVSYKPARTQVLAHDRSGCIKWSETFIRARASGPWSAGETKQLQIYHDGELSNDTLTAVNSLVSLRVSTSGDASVYDVIIGFVDNQWQLVGFDYRKLLGYTEGSRKLMLAGQFGLEFLSPAANSILTFDASGAVKVIDPPSSLSGLNVLTLQDNQVSPFQWKKLSPGATV